MRGVDIFDLRDVAQELELRNRSYPPEPPRELTPIERAGLHEDGTTCHLPHDYPPGRYMLGEFTMTPSCLVCHQSVITIADRGGICRQCRLSRTGQDA